jgi:hypothetical protein
MHVPASICCRHRDSCSHCLASCQVSVKKRKKQPATLQTSLEMPLVCYLQPSLEKSLLCYSIEMCSPLKIIYIRWFHLPFCEWNGYAVCTLHRIWHRHDHRHLVYGVCQFAVTSVDLFCAISTLSLCYCSCASSKFS